MLLHEFLSENKAELVERCRAKVSRRSPLAATRGLQHGIAPFLGQLIKTLQVEQTSDPMQSRKVSGPAGGQIAGSEIEGTAVNCRGTVIRSTRSSTTTAIFARQSPTWPSNVTSRSTRTNSGP